MVYAAAARRAFCSNFSLRTCAPVSRRFCRAAASAAARSSRNLTSVEAGAGAFLRSIMCSKRSSVSEAAARLVSYLSLTSRLKREDVHRASLPAL